MRVGMGDYRNKVYYCGVGGRVEVKLLWPRLKGAIH